MCSPNATPLTECIACGSTKLALVLDLGMQPPANSYKDTADEVQEEFPLAINRCENCYHVQLTHIVNPDILYKNYLYVSGTSQTMRNHFDWFARWSIELFRQLKGSYQREFRILDIGCNDGSQLDAFSNLSKFDGTDCLQVETFGVDPARNLHALSTSKGHTVEVGYFDDDYLDSHLGKTEGFDIMVAQNVFAHNPDPVSFLQRASALMSNDGILLVQTSQADMILNNEFDTIYHEHISFYNINSMNELCKRAGVYLIDAIKCPLHGNSYIFIITDDWYKQRPAHIDNLIAMERQAGLLSEETYKTYAENAQKIIEDFKGTVGAYTHPMVGWKVIGYGAAAKGMTFLNSTKVKLDFIVDDNPLKQGKFTPGLGIPIVSSDELKKQTDSCLLIPLAWNFYDEIKAKIKATKPFNRFDVYVRYFPEVIEEENFGKHSSSHENQDSQSVA